MERMIARNGAPVANDAQLIGTWEVTRTEDGINLRADARRPTVLAAGPYGPTRRCRAARRYREYRCGRPDV
jgi:hypothetical protein